VTRYLCTECGTSHSSKRRVARKAKLLWKKHIWNRQTAKQLEETYGESEKTIRRYFDRIEVRGKKHKPRPLVLAIDASFFHRGDGFLVAKDPLKSEVVYATEISSETKSEYEKARKEIERLGYTIQAVVLDGRTGISTVFDGLPIQICQFHQLQIVRRKLTLKPETEAGKELLKIGLNITRHDEKSLGMLLGAWHEKNHLFIEEKTYTLGTRRWRYTHRRMRSAYRSLIKNLPYLYTCQKYPELKIPNTTNCLDGHFSSLKEKLGVHRGQNKKRRWNMIRTILGI
jgi:hypothetical protein